jgi:hypothetical protein
MPLGGAVHDRQSRDRHDSDETSAGAGLAPGRRPLTVHRKATSDGSLEGAHAATVVDRAEATSSGGALPDDVRGRAEASFGHDFSSVRVHADGAAASAAQGLHASAFTVGSDIYFDRGQYAPGTEGGDHLLAHELAHVVQGAGAAASAAGTGPTVSRPDDPSEGAADAAADRFVRGEPAGAVGGPPRAIVSLDGLGDLRSAVDGGIFSGPDLADVWAKLALLSDGERAQLATSAGAHFSTVSDIVALIHTGPDLIRFFREVRHFTLFWTHWWYTQSGVALTKAEWDQLLVGLAADEKLHLATLPTYVPTMTALVRSHAAVADLIATLTGLGALTLLRTLHWINVAGLLASLTEAQWNGIVVFAPPDQREELRGDATVYAAFLQRAPAHLIAPRERIDGLRSGAWAPTPAELTETIASLSPAQKAPIRDDTGGLMPLIVARAQSSVPDLFRVLRDLDQPIKWAIWFLKDVIGSVSAVQWGELCGGATAGEMAELDGWAEVKTLFEASCPENIRTVRGEATTAAADPVAFTASLNRARIQELLDALGPAGLLDLVAGPEHDADANYTRLRNLGYVDRVVAGLPDGSALGARTQAALRQWFFHPTETWRSRLGNMFGKRFGVRVNEGSALKHSADGLRQSWRVLESLPPAQVEGNEEWDVYIRAHESGGGVYWSDGTIEMMYRNRGDLASLDTMTTPFQEGGQYGTAGTPGASPAVPTSFFNSTLRHEIGHAVDQQLGLMDRMQADARCGGWRLYGNATAFVDAIIAQYPGGIADVAHGYPAADVGDYRAAMIRAVTQHLTFQAAIDAIAAAATPSRVAAAAPDAGPISVVFDTSRWQATEDPWDQATGTPTPGDRRFHEAYEGNDRLCSYDGARRTAHNVSDYQWRAPGEWFAEAYMVYYGEQEAAPDAPVGGMLRARDAEAAAMMSSIVDRGYSPQEMRGASGRPNGATVGPPGVPAPGGGGGGGP